MSNELLFSDEGERELIRLKENLAFYVSQKHFSFDETMKAFSKQVNWNDPQSINLHIAKCFYLSGYVNALRTAQKRN